MKKIAISVVSALVLATPAMAATGDEFKAAYAKAEQADSQAKAMGSAWTVTDTALKDAQRAAADQQFDKAVALAKRADALAQASIRQGHEQRTAWRAAVVQ